MKMTKLAFLVNGMILLQATTSVASDKNVRDLYKYSISCMGTDKADFGLYSTTTVPICAASTLPLLPIYTSIDIGETLSSEDGVKLDSLQETEASKLIARIKGANIHNATVNALAGEAVTNELKDLMGDFRSHIFNIRDINDGRQMNNNDLTIDFVLNSFLTINQSSLNDLKSFY